MGTSYLRGLIAGSILASFQAAALAQTTIYVDAERTTGANDGSSWANAYQGRLGLRHALDALSPGAAEIWVAQGVYAPAGVNGDRMLSFAMRNNLRVLGGFAGTETSSAQRDPAAHETVLSGDLNENDAWLSIPSTMDNSHHVVRADGCDATAEIDGFTIKHGDANQHGLSDHIDKEAGGGIFIVGGTPRISGCTVEFCNASWFGGGMAISGASPTITECVIASNRCQQFGAGVAITSGSTALIQDCQIRENSGANGTGLFSGPVPGESAGINAEIIRRCRFVGNLGNISVGQGTGMCDQGGAPLVDACEFRENVGSSSGGGLLLMNSTATIRNCLFAANAALADPGDAINAQGGAVSVEGCVFVDHHPTNMFFPFNFTVVAANSGTLTLSNCTVTRNGGAGDTAAVVAFGSATMMVRNCIVSNNANVNGTGFDAGFRSYFGGIARVDRSCVQGWNGQLPGTGSFNADPQFAGAPATDLRLAATSPCIDAGNNAYAPSGLAVDAGGRPRRYDAPVADSGAGTSPLVDIGAYEFVCAADIDADNTVDLVDFFAFFNAFDTTQAPADVDGSGVVDLSDFFVFFNAFDTGC